MLLLFSSSFCPQFKSVQICSKCFRAMVKYWIQNSINIVLYLYDGLGMCNILHEFQNHSSFAKDSLIEAGFLINEEKSIDRPSKGLEKLGIVWNSDGFSLSIPDRRVIDLLVN